MLIAAQKKFKRLSFALTEHNIFVRLFARKEMREGFSERLTQHQDWGLRLKSKRRVFTHLEKQRCGKAPRKPDT